jgi:hypothetical protein
MQCFSSRGFPLENASEHCFLSIKVLFWCCCFIYRVVLLLFSGLFIFYSIIIDMVPYIYLVGPLYCHFVARKIVCWRISNTRFFSMRHSAIYEQEVAFQEHCAGKLWVAWSCGPWKNRRVGAYRTPL